MKDIHEVGKKFMSNKFSRFFLPKLKIKGLRKNCVLCHKFSSNQDLDMFGTSKCSSELYFCESYLCSLWEKWPEMVLKWPTHNIVTF